MYKNILFDLDGTLTDSGEGIMNAIVYATKKMNWPTPDDETLRSFIGPPLLESFKKLAVNSAEAAQAVSYYRDYYKEKGLFENLVYPEIPETLNELKRDGAQLYVATSKPEVFAKQILEHFQLASYFEGIYGASLDGQRSKKGDVIRYALAEAGIQPTKDDSVMIGDRSHDILGARENQLASIGVLYGFGDREELQLAGATAIISQPSDLIPLILGRN